MSCRNRAGGLLLFDHMGKMYALLGREYIHRLGTYVWVEFAGKVDLGESFTQTACRECNEETAFTLTLTVDMFERAERRGHYVDHVNSSTGVVTRMYTILVPGEMPNIEDYELNSRGKESVGVVQWGYFPVESVVYNRDGKLPDTKYELFSATASEAAYHVEELYMEV
jgi:8-oxo-dGTP pyrophosphatase MutT (NUDIX family)